MPKNGDEPALTAAPDIPHGTGARDITVVIPVYNEEECLPLLERELLTTLRDYPHPWEVILVNDGSSDRSAEVIVEICGRNPQFRALHFARNCGQSAAMAAGFRAARAHITVTLDADLQNDPADIPRLLEHMRDHDCVCGWRQKRHDSAFRRLQSRIANGVRNWVLGEDIKDVSCSLKAYRTDLLQKIHLFRGAHRFLPTLLKLEGANVIELPVNHRPRAAGVPKWGLWNRVFRATVDLFGVRWLKNRAFRYVIAKETGRGLPPSGNS